MPPARENSWGDSDIWCNDPRCVGLIETLFRRQDRLCRVPRIVELMSPAAAFRVMLPDQWNAAARPDRSQTAHP